MLIMHPVHHLVHHEIEGEVEVIIGCGLKPCFFSSVEANTPLHHFMEDEAEDISEVFWEIGVGDMVLEVIE